MICPQCFNWQISNYKFCPSDGAGLVSHSCACGYELTITQKFCPICGKVAPQFQQEVGRG